MRKRALYVTFQSPSNCSGGGLCILQSLISLHETGYNIDYVGPEFDRENLSIPLSEMFCLNPHSGALQRILGILRGITTRFYGSWKKVEKQLDWGEYDLVFLEISRYHFVTKRAKKFDKKVTVRIQNVEKDYFDNLKKINNSFLYRFRSLFAYTQEKKCLSSTDVVICLTAKDKERLMQLYPFLDKKKVEVIPICLASKKLTSYPCRKDILITGTLNYGPNVEGILWFIQNVWNKYHFDCNLIVAGSEPNDEVSEIIRESNQVVLVDSPEDMAEYFRTARISVAPILSGAGMKVKVAEAFSYGLPVIGSTHAFIGYEIEEEKKIAYVADTPEQYYQAIKKLLEKSEKEQQEIREDAIIFFKNHNSIEKSIESFRKLNINE